MRDVADVLVLDSDPALRRLHHASAVHRTEAEVMVDVVTAAVDRPSVLLAVRDSRRFHDDVLHVAPRQVTTANTSQENW